MNAPATSTRIPRLRPLAARSVILSVLLAAHPPEAAVADLIGFADAFGIQPMTTRVALSRMVTAGDLDRTDSTYRLSARLLARQHRQDRLLNARATEPWDYRWRTVVEVSASVNSGAHKALRTRLRDQRFAELREGVWLRPDNIDLDLPADPGASVELLSAVPDTDPTMLAQRLFDLDDWAEAATDLLSAMRDAHTPMERVTVAAAIVRHLLTDPLMPADLLEDTWPGPPLHATYSDYQHELVDLRDTLRD